ncbi:DUF2516 family protein [Arthrobacter psychrochitiniphilus]|uniref:DUF2516 domain-containing protein n=2 Tax=Arthrobacter TaxID=1663 RepID=A0A2V3DTG6_9MICC|nr:DUF2516 domain-containing protein [Arthrobacter psychrochitiniphilus]
MHFLEFLILVALGLLAFGVQVWALADCLRTPPSDFERVYKRTKTFWAALTGGASFFGFLYIIGPIMTLTVPPLGMMLLLTLGGATAAGVYLADVRPALVEVRARKRGGQNRGSSW